MRRKGYLISGFVFMIFSIVLILAISYAQAVQNMNYTYYREAAIMKVGYAANNLNFSAQGRDSILLEQLENVFDIYMPFEDVSYDQSKGVMVISAKVSPAKAVVISAGVPKCGNSKAELGEQCDGVDLRGRTCNDLIPGSTGTLQCKPPTTPSVSACVYDVSGCSL